MRTYNGDTSQTGHKPLPPLPVLFKTVSSDCNLDCSYCYYRESLEGTRVRRRLEEPLLATFMRQYMEYVADTGVASLVWQGGEPTLAGLEFFERAVDLEVEFALRGATIGNALQTNAVLLDDRWGEFLRQYNFLIGVSLDGPEEVHDSARRDRGGHGSFGRTMAGIDVLRKHRVDFNVLCVIGPHNVRRVGDLMRFFHAEGFSHLQFIPAMAFQSVEPNAPASYLITPEEYGDFLVELFDKWYQQGFPTVSVRTFDALIQSYLGAASDLCVYGERCDSGIVVEYNGDVYPCDFYVSEDWRLGNVMEQSLESILARPARTAFVERKALLPPRCQACEWRRVCRGGCPRNRLNAAPGRAPEYFCESHQRFFRHADERLRSLGERLECRLRTASVAGRAAAMKQTAAERNERCPCGSGLKYKACCGEPRANSSYLFRSVLDAPVGAAPSR
jgi:uncharacterized protein